MIRSQPITRRSIRVQQCEVLKNRLAWVSLLEVSQGLFVHGPVG